MCTRQSRNVIWDMINTLFRLFSCRTYISCFLLALTNIRPWPLVAFFQISLKNSELQNRPQYLSRLSPALFPTTFFEITVFTTTNRAGVAVVSTITSYLLTGCRNVLTASKNFEKSQQKIPESAPGLTVTVAADYGRMEREDCGFCQGKNVL